MVIQVKAGIALESEHHDAMAAISAASIRRMKERSPALSVIALLECLSDASIRRNLKADAA